MISRCPDCGGQTLFSDERFDSCSCGYQVYYRDAYAEIEQAERQKRIEEKREGEKP